MPSGPARRTLARRLEHIADFVDPSVELEQYLTPAELAAHVVYLAAVQGDLHDRLVVDLGAGTGMLALAASYYGPAVVLGVELDPVALDRARENECRLAERAGTDGRNRTTCSWVRADATRLPLDRSRLEDASDRPVTPDHAGGVTVLSNPPFGAQRGNRHADRRFLQAIGPIADVSYTIHNEGSQSFVESFVDDAGGDLTHGFAADFPIDHRFGFHDRERTTLEAEVFRIEWPQR